MTRLKSPVRSVNTRKCGMGVVLAASFSNAASLLAFPGLATKQLRTTNIFSPLYSPALLASCEAEGAGNVTISIEVRNNLSPSRPKMNGVHLATVDSHRNWQYDASQSHLWATA